MLILDKFNRFVRQRIHASGGRSRDHVIDGYHLHSYEIDGQGDGPPVVLVHGLGASAHSFFSMLKGLRATWSKIYIPDLPGHGYSRHGTPLTIRGQQQIFLGYLDRVVREPAALVGNSMGGAIVLQSAIDRPQTPAVALLSPAGAPLTDEDIRWLQRGFALDSRAKAIDFFHRLTHRRQSLVAWLIASDLMETFRVPSVQHVVQAASPEDRFEDEQVRALQMPMLLVWGMSEKILPPSGIEYFRRALPPHARIELMEQCGHLPMMEQPRRTLELLHDLARQAKERQRLTSASSM